MSPSASTACHVLSTQCVQFHPTTYVTFFTFCTFVFVYYLVKKKILMKMALSD